MTCNPRWREIEVNLRPGQQPSEQPQLVARVFHEKVKQIYSEIKKDKIFGEPRGIVYTIEFQKRGLPHMHMAVILDRNMHPDSPQLIDRLVSAELPDPVEDPELYQLVSKHMMHGPCGEQDPTSCMKDGVCTKGYAKQFRGLTGIDDNGFPQYRRRDNGRTARCVVFEGK